MDKILFENYKKTIKQKFNAVCFDIDGTLTKEGSHEIADESLKIIGNLLRRGVPVIFITGRGETGLDQLKEKLSLYLKKENLIDQNVLSNMYALINDGAKLCEFDYNTKEIFGKQKLLIDKELLTKLELISEEIEAMCNEIQLKDCCKVTFSKDSTTNKKINIRVVFNTKEEDIILSTFSKINELIKKINIKDLCLTRGFYKDKSVLQIGFSIKDNAIKLTEKILGIPENSMLRIGDCGDERGNDFSMLNCSQGFSVDKTSRKKDKCFPVFDKNGKKLKGLIATEELINQAKILKTICLEKADKESYAKSYALLEKEIIIGRNKYLDEFNLKIKNIFNCYEGMNDIFDPESGSVKIPMYEWELIDDNNPLKQLWSKGKDSSLYYSLRDNQNFLLRGSKTYYYFLANRYNGNVDLQNKNVDITSKDNVIEWFDNYVEFTNYCLEAIENTQDLDEIYNKRMLLGVLDNFRNYLLIMIYCYLVLDNNDNILINLEKLDKNSNIYFQYEVLKEILNLMENICFNEEYKLNKREINLIILKILKSMLEEKKIFLEKSKLDNYSKVFRAYREIDDFAENYIAISLSIDKILNKDVGVCGISYGGLELPIIYKIINGNIEDVSILTFNKATAGYAKKHSIELRLFDINDYGSIKLTGINKNKKYVLMDDNILSGKTVQLAITTLYDVGIDTDSVIIVRYPSINRIDQMFMPGHGAVAHTSFFSFIKGLCFPSPYTWRDENEFNNYEDSLGVFDLNREKILKCLYKNHDFSEQSEVCKYKKRIIK